MGIEKKLEECYQHIKPYLGNEEDTPLLNEMCKMCEFWNGEEHDYEECRNKACFKLFLGYQYLCWEDGYDD